MVAYEIIIKVIVKACNFLCVYTMNNVCCYVLFVIHGKCLLLLHVLFMVSGVYIVASDHVIYTFGLGLEIKV